ncbi:MAG: hypothetical protein P4M07_01555 [Xanthobacteraceae bacterium]|nr:hypothetical protein [Xanthobacteraceae bacterium]
MKYRALLAVTVGMLALAPLALAQVPGGAGAGYVPHLGDIMGATQLRHIKLSFAGKLRNWALAAYELDQIKTSFQDAATLYPGIPITDMTIVADPVQRLSSAIEAKDGPKFDRAFAALTDACNACHRAIDRGFIVVQVPAASPFSNQSFAPGSK